MRRLPVSFLLAAAVLAPVVASAQEDPRRRST